MSAQEVFGIIRTILAAFSGYVVAHGWLDDATYQSLLGALGVVFTAVWSVASKKSAPPAVK